jgi:ATP synthase mitochondrial F1 complex assembly factor 2
MLHHSPEYHPPHHNTTHTHPPTHTHHSMRTAQPELVVQQKAELDPLVRWFQDTFKVGLHVCQPFADPYACAGEFAASSQLSTHEQPENTITRMQWYLHSLDDWSLCGLQLLSQTTKSVILPLAVLMNRLDGEQALHLSRLEELFQLSKWKFIEAAHDLDEADLRVRALSGSAFLRLLDNHTTLPKL